ncbi:ABC transporter ATP-binding protein [Lusitaniella coriacea LEGE 07157]|uniref:Spermidine/putrescine import ATP-binding protein PotA n=1 Tax=Lusitaniella coriacea LEGE 07157 TaxID=945747 RepID=A0A8J7DZJ2_9CYAN|nr:ABC transporter ATP-binding protein [Lusitaniella coriacea]MBE9118253.1 ABC transporter ATP-binding protein [Lusitaniella coriacea LEGE 07157]
MAQTFIPIEDSARSASVPFDVELRQLFKVFNGEPVVKGVDLAIRKGEFFSILGPSGCGKTTILRAIAGFEIPSSGEVLIQEQPMNDVPPYRRPVNTVFQSYALFNHLTVAENIAFGLKIKRLPKSEVETRVLEALAGVRMESFARRYPNQLSGGQRQRVALARALVNRPAVVLLDEPLGALDLKLRKEMQVELRKLHRELGLTFVMVTHDQEEALSLSDRIAVIRGGKIEQVGTPSEIYERPKTAFVADFIGDTNLFQGRVTARGETELTIATESGLQIVVRSASFPDSDRVVASVRPEKIKLSLDPPNVEQNCFEGRLQHAMYLGTRVQYVVELLTGEMVMVMQPNLVEDLPELDTPIYAFWLATDCLALENFDDSKAEG